MDLKVEVFLKDLQELIEAARQIDELRSQLDLCKLQIQALRGQLLEVMMCIGDLKDHR